MGVGAAPKQPHKSRFGLYDRLIFLGLLQREKIRLITNVNKTADLYYIISVYCKTLIFGGY